VATMILSAGSRIEDSDTGLSVSLKGWESWERVGSLTSHYDIGSWDCERGRQSNATIHQITVQELFHGPMRDRAAHPMPTLQTFSTYLVDLFSKSQIF